MELNDFKDMDTTKKALAIGVGLIFISLFARVLLLVGVLCLLYVAYIYYKSYKEKQDGKGKKDKKKDN